MRLCDIQCYDIFKYIYIYRVSKHLDDEYMQYLHVSMITNHGEDRG